MQPPQDPALTAVSLVCKPSPGPASHRLKPITVALFFFLQHPKTLTARPNPPSPHFAPAPWTKKFSSFFARHRHLPVKRAYNEILFFLFQDAPFLNYEIPSFFLPSPERSFFDATGAVSGSLFGPLPWQFCGNRSVFPDFDLLNLHLFFNPSNSVKPSNRRKIEIPMRFSPPP